MPIYEYKCSGCGKGFAQLVRSPGEERKLTCPACGNKRVERQFSVFATPRPAGKSPPPGPCGSCGSFEGACPYK